MEYRLLGRTGVSVSPLCLGTMMFGPWGNDDRADAIRVIHRALDAGINFVDTADVYSGGVSEEITGEALQGRRDDVVLATKFFMPMDDRPNRSGGSRKWIMQEVENSLRRLKTDYIDLYQVHRPSATTDVEETLGALTLVEPGVVATELPNHITHADTKHGVQQLYDKAEVTAADVAEIIAFILSRPRRLAISEILLRPAGQQ